MALLYIIDAATTGKVTLVSPMANYFCKGANKVMSGEWTFKELTVFQIIMEDLL